MRILWSLCFIFFACPAFAAEYTMETAGGKQFRLESSEPRITTRTDQLLLCGPAIDAVTFVKLWMPNHGHGSTPVQLSEAGGQCRALTRVNFTMPGTWDVVVKLKGQDSGVFSVPVSRR